MYATGQGTAKDYPEAMRWYTKAAERCDASAQNNLGSMYATGKAVPRDLVQAHKWYTLAAAHFAPDEAAFRDKAVRNADTIAAKMTPEQIAEAQRLAREWQPTRSDA